MPALIIGYLLGQVLGTVLWCCGLAILALLRLLGWLLRVAFEFARAGWRYLRQRLEPVQMNTKVIVLRDHIKRRKGRV